MTLLDFWLVFALGLVSSLHCAQMCGPLVLGYSLPRVQSGAGRGRMLLAHLGYNTGRILTYTALGAAAGAVGSAAGMLGRMAGMANGARMFAGGAMVLAGVLMLTFKPATGLVALESPTVTQRFLRAIGQRLMRAKTFHLGLLMGFLPCGLIYGALLKAVDSGAALPGALTMLAFGLGTAQALLGVGMASPLVGRFLGRWSNRVAAACLMLFGIFLLWRGIIPPAGAACHAHS